MNDDSVSALDQRLLKAYARAWEKGAAVAGNYVRCAAGCSACCLGVFEISGLDAWRLQQGLTRLAATQPSLAGLILARARQQWEEIKPFYPGMLKSGALTGNENVRKAFYERFAHLPCPLLDVSKGLCLLYEYRPLACRSFGLPWRVGDVYLPPCPRNFVAATLKELEAACHPLDSEDQEADILQALGNPPDTIVAAAICASASKGWEYR